MLISKCVTVAVLFFAPLPQSSTLKGETAILLLSSILNQEFSYNSKLVILCAFRHVLGNQENSWQDYGGLRFPDIFDNFLFFINFLVDSGFQTFLTFFYFSSIFWWTQVSRHFSSHFGQICISHHFLGKHLS